MNEPLTLAAVLVDLNGTPIAEDEFVVHLEEYGDIKLFAGHIDQVEADCRLVTWCKQSISWSDDSGELQTVQSDLTHRWAIFERHDPEACDDALYPPEDPADEGLTCSCEDDWYVRWVDEGTTDAIAVTTAFADGEW